MKAVLHFDASPTLRRRFEAAAPPWLQVTCVGGNDVKELHRELADAEILLHVLSPVTSELLDSAPKLQLIQKIGVGVNTIDLEAARARAVYVANMPGSNSQAVCEFTLALLLAVLRKLTLFHAATRGGHGWALPPETFDGVGEVGGRTVGLVGFGEIPRRLAPVLDALGARVLVHTRRQLSEARRQVSLDELLATSDVVSLHVPLTAETQHLMNDHNFSLMKPGAILINTARGGLVDEGALCRALNSGHLAGAGLDVLDQEPASASSPILAMPNVVVTPHIAWLTSETLDRSLAVIVENCRRLRDGLPLCNQVNF